MSQGSKIPPQLVLVDGDLWSQFSLWALGNNLEIHEEPYEFYASDNYVLHLSRTEAISDRSGWA